MRRDARFNLAMSDEEKRALEALAIRDGTSAAATLRRLLLSESRRVGLLQPISAGGQLGGLDALAGGDGGDVRQEVSDERREA